MFGQAASAGVAPAEPEDEKETVVVRPPELETGAKGEGEGDEGGAEGEQQPEGIWQVAPQLATPAKLPPAVLDPTVKTTRGRSQGDTPSRDEVLRQNVADRMAGMEADAAQWAVVVVPKATRELSAAAEFKQEEAARSVRKGPLFGDQNFIV